MILRIFRTQSLVESIDACTSIFDNINRMLPVSKTFIGQYKTHNQFTFLILNYKSYASIWRVVCIIYSNRMQMSFRCSDDGCEALRLCNLFSLLITIFAIIDSTIANDAMIYMIRLLIDAEIALFGSYWVWWNMWSGFLAMLNPIVSRKLLINKHSNVHKCPIVYSSIANIFKRF